MELLIIPPLLGVVAYFLVRRLTTKRTCPGCGRAIVAGLAHCPFCSAAYAREGAPSPGVVPSLVALQGAWRGKLFPLSGGQFSIGRGGKNDVALEEARVSRQHAEIVYQDGQYVLWDRGSQQGTYVNGQRISQAVLRPGDQIQIGSSVFLFEVGLQLSFPGEGPGPDLWDPGLHGDEASGPPKAGGMGGPRLR